MPQAHRSNAVPSPTALVERNQFAIRVRAVRAVLGWSQTELAKRSGLTQRSIHRIEQAAVDVRQSTQAAIDRVIQQTGVQFEQASGDTVMITIPGGVIRRQLRE
jgi:transcriptional regulator with XRE-family HTH domain